jgi:hypothetical protein
MTIRVQGNVVINNSRDATVRNVTATGTISLTGNATSIRQNTTGTWSGNAPNGVGKLEYHSNRWYINAGANSTETLVVRRGSSNVFRLSNSGEVIQGIVPWARLTGHPTITAGDGLSGGGNLSTNRTINVDNTVMRFLSSHRLERLSGNTGTNADQVWLLVPFSGGNNECIGKIYNQRSSGHYEAFDADIIISTTSSGTQPSNRGSIRNMVVRNGRVCSLIIATFEGVNYWALRWRGGSFMVSDVFFNGYIRGNGNALRNLPISSVTVVQNDLVSTDVTSNFYHNVVAHGNLVLGNAGTSTNQAVRADRTISTGSGLSGGGNLTANRTFSVDGTVVRTTGNQSIAGTKTFTGDVRLNVGGGVALNNHFRFNSANSGLVWGIQEISSNGHLVFQTRSGTGSWTTRVNWGTNGTLLAGTVPWARVSGAPAFLTTVNLGRSEATTSVTITNTAGSNATIRDATTGRAGLVTTGNQTWGGTKTTTRVDGTSQMRSPIYYDRGNTSYLVRPANTGTSGTRLRGVRVDRLGIGAAASGSTGDLRVTRSVGVGTTPSGTIGQLRATNNIIAYSSDRRLKTNIFHIRSPIEKVQQLDGVEFEWDREECEKWGFYPEEKDIGLLAQQVQSVLPEAVKPAPFDMDRRNNSRSGKNYLTVQYEKLVPLLIEAIKEQQVRIESLEETVKKSLTHTTDDK